MTLYTRSYKGKRMVGARNNKEQPMRKNHVFYTLCTFQLPIYLLKLCFEFKDFGLGRISHCIPGQHPPIIYLVRTHRNLLGRFGSGSDQDLRNAVCAEKNLVFHNIIIHIIAFPFQCKDSTYIYCSPSCRTYRHGGEWCVIHYTWALVIKPPGCTRGCFIGTACPGYHGPLIRSASLYGNVHLISCGSRPERWHWYSDSPGLQHNYLYFARRSNGRSPCFLYRLGSPLHYIPHYCPGRSG